MVPLLVLGTFLTFILLDWLLNRNKVTQPAAAVAAGARASPQIEPEHVEGFPGPAKTLLSPRP